MSLLVAIVLGPVLIPWILVPQLQFLAWGWFRTLLGAGVHMMVAGACFAGGGSHPEDSAAAFRRPDGPGHHASGGIGRPWP